MQRTIIIHIPAEEGIVDIIEIVSQLFDAITLEKLVSVERSVTGIGSTEHSATGLSANFNGSLITRLKLYGMLRSTSTHGTPARNAPDAKTSIRGPVPVGDTDVSTVVSNSTPI